MAENMYEQSAVWCEPVCNAAQQQLVIAEVFEHFDRNDPIELLTGFKIADVSRDHFDIGQPTFLAACFDKTPLPGRIGQRSDLAIREVLRHP